MSNDRNPFGGATRVAEGAKKAKPKRKLAHVVRRAKLPSQSPAPATAPATAPSEATSPIKAMARAHVIRRDSAGLPEDSSEVLLTPPNITVPMGKAGSSAFHPEGSGGLDEFTVEEGRPQPPAAMVNLAEQASLAVAPPDDPDRGFLVITDGNDKGRKVGLPEGRTTIGRGIDCDIVLTDITVSRRHMYVERRDNVYFLCDLSSGNGTIVNDRDRRGEVVVVNGDTFRIGNTVFSFEGPDAQDSSAAATTNWQPDAASGGEPVAYESRREQPQGDSLDNSMVEAEESTVAGKGLAGSSRAEYRDPPSELPTNIVPSVEVSPQIPDAPQRPAPPPMPQDKRDVQDAAIAAVSSIVATPAPEEVSVIPLETGDLPEASIPSTPQPVIPYPIPGQNAGQNAGHQPKPSLPRPAPGPMPPMQGSGPYPNPAPHHMQQGAMGMAPMQGSGPYPNPAPHNLPQGSNPMMGRPMVAGARPDFHNPYAPASQQQPQQRGRLLIGIISVALVLVVVGIVAAVVGQNGEKSVAAESTATGDESADTTGAQAVDTEGTGTEGTDTEGTDTEGTDTEGTDTEGTADSVASAATGPDGGSADQSPELPAQDTGPKPILVASLIAGNSQLPASTWGTDESFQASLPPLETKPEPIVIPEPIEEPEDDPAEEPEVDKPEPEVDKPKATSKPRVASKPRPSVRKPREIDKPTRRAKVDDEPDDEPENDDIDTGAAKSSARSLYARRKFDEAVAILQKAANKIDNDREANGLSDTADAYKAVGKFLTQAENAQSSNPAESLGYYKKALSRDKKYARGALAKLIRLRIGQVAPKAARAFMAQGKLADARKAADTAKRYDEGQAVEAVYRSLERKADSLIKKALRAKDDGDDDKAKDLLREATNIAPKGTDAYDKCRKELRRF